MKTISILLQLFALLMLAIESTIAQTNVPASKAPQKSPWTYQVQAYHFDGETFLPPEKLNSVLSNYTGKVNLARVIECKDKMQEIYRQAGYTNIKVVVPPQRITNATIHMIAVIIGSKDDYDRSLSPITTVTQVPVTESNKSP